jgi:translation initiation factor IF-2
MRFLKVMSPTEEATTQYQNFQAQNLTGQTIDLSQFNKPKKKKKSRKSPLISRCSWQLVANKNKKGKGLF